MVNLEVVPLSICFHPHHQLLLLYAIKSFTVHSLPSCFYFVVIVILNFVLSLMSICCKPAVTNCLFNDCHLTFHVNQLRCQVWCTFCCFVQHLLDVSNLIMKLKVVIDIVHLERFPTQLTLI